MHFTYPIRRQFTNLSPAVPGPAATRQWVPTLGGVRGEKRAGGSGNGPSAVALRVVVDGFRILLTVVMEIYRWHLRSLIAGIDGYRKVRSNFVCKV